MYNNLYYGIFILLMMKIERTNVFQSNSKDKQRNYEICDKLTETTKNDHLADENLMNRWDEGQKFFKSAKESTRKLFLMDQWDQ